MRSTPLLFTILLLVLVPSCEGSSDDSSPGDIGSDNGLDFGVDRDGEDDSTSTDTDGGEAPDGAGDGGDVDSTVVPHSFTVTIDNQTTQALFVDGLWLPFGLRLDEQGFTLTTFCSCDQCNNGGYCAYPEPMAVVVELPAGDQLTVEADLLWYTQVTVDEETCPEVPSWVGFCDEAHAFIPGVYTLVLAFDDLVAIEEQDLTPSDQQRWGHTLWMQEDGGIGTATLSQVTEQSFVLEGDSSAVTFVLE